GAFAEAGRILTGGSAGTDAADVAAGVQWVKGLCDRLGAPPLSDFGMTAAAVPGIAAKGLAASSMRGNPVQLSQGELERILHQAL
ncbi:MAG: iron-containing alcohol dehydrogenase, partial [Desulfolutivibrio sp.]